MDRQVNIEVMFSGGEIQQDCEYGDYTITYGAEAIVEIDLDVGYHRCELAIRTEDQRVPERVSVRFSTDGPVRVFVVKVFDGLQCTYEDGIMRLSSDGSLWNMVGGDVGHDIEIRYVGDIA